MHDITVPPPAGQPASQSTAFSYAAHTGIPGAHIGMVIGKHTPDRASVVATGIMQIFATAQRPELRQALEDLLREEFAEVQRQAITEGELVDA